jgi:hypothetical protein
MRFIVISPKKRRDKRAANQRGRLEGAAPKVGII